MRRWVSLSVVSCLAVSLVTAAFTSAEAAAPPLVRDYAKETQTNQFRPHGGDKQEIGDILAAFANKVKTPAEIEKMVVSDSKSKADFLKYAKSFEKYRNVKVVTTSVEKLYTVTGFDVFHKYRAIAKFKYLGYVNENKPIEKTDYLGLAKFGKSPSDWKFWGVVWRDSGIDVSDAQLFQLEKPKAGEEICVMTTDAGVIKMRLFPEQAPKTVKNFKALAQKSYYDNMPFLRVINDFMIQGGSLDGSPTAGDCIYGKYFEDEFSRNLFNFKGALCMGNEGIPNTNGNQFYIVQTPNVIQEHLDLSSLPLNAKTKYKELGGRPYLDMRYTVFGQVFEGMEAVDKIAAQKTDENDKPVKDPMKILKIEFVKY